MPMLKSKLKPSFKGGTGVMWPTLHTPSYPYHRHILPGAVRAQKSGKYVGKRK